jgi:hypothetical protein
MGNESPFQPGARVAIQQNYGFSGVRYVEAFVEKVHKTGRFTLKDFTDKKQWRPWHCNNFGRPRWEATQAGSNFNGRLLIWDAETDAEIARVNAEAVHDRKVRAARNRVEDMKFQRITPEVLAHLEAAIAAYGSDPA